MSDDSTRFERDRKNQKAVSVYTAVDELEANIVRELLRTCGIECVVQGRVLTGFYHASIGDWSKREIFVLEDDVEDAREVLADWQAGDPSLNEADS